MVRLMIAQHVAQASQLTGGRAEALKFSGDDEGRNDWINILNTIPEMATTVPFKLILETIH